MHAPLSLDLAPLHARPGAGVVAALSGGLDSAVLLHLLASSPQVRERGLRALHVNHGLHADADRWQAHCVAECARLGIPMATARVDVRPVGDGPEGAARRARHAAFADALLPGELLALAHHRDDQAETFLLRALRASGPDGLSAMRAVRACGPGWLWRPLLAVPRSELQAYALRHGLAWIDDPGNDDGRFDRNFIRHRVMPLLRERWPNADEAFAQAASLCGESTGLLEHEDAAVLAAARTVDRDVLDLRVLRDAGPPRRARVLRRWIAELALPALPADALRRVEGELLPAPTDSEAEVQWPGGRMRRWRHLLQASAPAPRWELDAPLDWDGTAALKLPLGDSLSLEPATSFPERIRVRARRGGESVQLPGRPHRHRLKHVLQERQVPAWDRERLPLLVDAEDRVLAAGDAVIAGAFAEWLAASGCRLVWHRRRAAS